jgi:hypothetical protein
LVVVVIFARNVLRADYFRAVIIPADIRTWSWLHRKLRLSENGLLILYRGFFLYGLSRMVAWFLYARFEVHTPLQLNWGGPRYLPGNDLSDASVIEVLIRTAIGGVLCAAFIALCWVTFVRSLWRRGVDLPAVSEGSGLFAAFD